LSNGPTTGGKGKKYYKKKRNERKEGLSLLKKAALIAEGKGKLDKGG